MAQDVELMQDKPSNACCAALKKKQTKLLEKYSKLEELKNKFRDCTALVQEKYDVIEKENENLKKALEEIRLQASVLNDEKEKEAGRRVDLEDEVSALQEEIQSLKQSGKSSSEEADEHLQERLVVAEKEIKHLKELLYQERGRAALEKKNAELEEKKADDALKKVDMGNNKISEAQKVANAERKKAEERRLLYEKLKKETDGMKSMLALEKSKFEAAEKKMEAEKQKAVRESKRADMNLKKATFEEGRADDFTRKFEEAKNRAEAAEKKVEVEKQIAVRERKRADLAVAKSEEQRDLAETNLKRAMFEKDRADDLNRKLEEARNRAEKLQEEMHKHKCSGKLVEAQVDDSNKGRSAELTSDVCMGMIKSDAQVSQWMKKMLLEKEHDILKEKKRADSEKKKAKKQRKNAEEQEKMAIEQKHRADQLSKELESCKLRFEELQKELQEFVSCRIYAINAPSRNSEYSYEIDTVKLLKKQLELERLVVKHAKKETKLEAFRNKMLHQELCHLKQECLQFQQRLDILDNSFLLGREGINPLEKIGNQTSGEMLCSDGYHSQLISGTDSKTDPPYGGSNRKMLQSSAINSSSASFSDRHLMGSQERGTYSVMTSVSKGEDVSNCEPKLARLSDTMKVRYNERDVAKANKSMRSPITDGANKRKVGNREKKRVLDAVESVENLYSKGQKLHQHVSEKLSVLHGILNRQKDDSKDENLKEASYRELSRPCKRRKTSSQGTLVVHHLQKSGKPGSALGSNMGRPNTCITASPGSDVMKLHGHLKDVTNSIYGRSLCTQGFDEMVTHDHMKLLDLDNVADENSYRRAIAMPLSPTLPEIEFHGCEEIEVDNPEMLVCMNFQEGLSHVRDNPVSVSSFDVIDSEKTCSIPNSHVPSQLQTGEGSIVFSKNMDLLSVSVMPFHSIHASGGKIGMSDQSGSGNEEISILGVNRTASFDGGLLKYFVVSSENKDNSSISRILQAIGNFIPQCSFIHSAETFLQSSLNALLKARDLSIKEKACVFFSLILHEISEVELQGLTDVFSDNSIQNLGSVTKHISSAFSEPAFRRIFMESCVLFELLAVIEDFLLQKRVLVCGEESADLTTKLKLIRNGNGVVVSEMVASAHLLVVGACLLASLCSEIDHIGFVCEVSLDIIRMQKSDHMVLLAVLHSFAHICGSKYLALEQYSLAMTAVKSLVIFLEKQILSSSEGKNPSKIWLCSNCPFSDGAMSMEDVALLLLENLQKQCLSESCSQDSLALVNLLVPRVRSNEEVTIEVSGLREPVPLSCTSDENLCDFIDNLSLVEVLASFMSWNWTYDHLVGRICEYLEPRLMEGSFAAIIILLGQLGRLGVDASGYEDSEVKKLKGWLSAFVCKTTFVKLSLSVQFAIITSLFSLTSVKLQDIVDGKVAIPAVMSQSIPASFIKEWFFSLSHEQQSFLRLHRAGSVNN